MSVRQLSHLRYLALATPKYEEQLEFMTKHWGLTAVQEDGNVAYLAAEGSPEPFSVRLRRGEKRVDLVAFGAHTRADVDA